MLRWLKSLAKRLLPKSKPDLIADSALRISHFVQQWPSQKLFDVYAFCEDGRMDYDNPCCCLLGVFGSATLHESCADAVIWGQPTHYSAIKRIPAMAQIERAYQILGYQTFDGEKDDQKLRDRRLLFILNSEMKRRAAADAACGERQPVGAL